MKFFHSVRWQLQFWYGLLLALALAGFGVSAWQLQRASQFVRIDRELEQRMAVVEGAVRAGVPGSRAAVPRPLDLSLRDQRIFEGEDGRQFYYVVWLNDGGMSNISALAPPGVPRPEARRGPPEFRSRGPFRECFHVSPGGECSLVGRNVGDELAGIRRTGWLLVGAGGAVLALGLAGGWLIAERSLRPISVISATAAKIAAGNLGCRNGVTDSESELGRLSGDLNHTFARLEAAFQRQRQFTADASHELRTPVAVILTQTQGVLARERTEPEYRESLTACGRAAQRMRGLIDSLLLLARFDSAESREHFGPCDLARIVEESVALLRPLAAGRGVSVEASISRAPLRGDSVQLAQAAANLVGNAIHHNRPGGSVRVSVHPENGRAVFTVSDTGPGIAPEHLPHIFERFYRVDKARSGSRGHSGLGLAITKSIVEAHGGAIHVSSELGAGSTFTVSLNLAEDGGLSVV